jgi:hypothetical protein
MMTDRRHFMKHMAGASAVALAGTSFMSRLRAVETEAKKKHKHLIVLWMSGGPTTIDLWDLKPGSPNGGEFKPINTAASGVQISEHLPNVAKQFKELAIIRSLRTTEGDHNRGTQLMLTGRTPNPLIDAPSICAIAAKKMTPEGLDLPSFITVGGGGRVGPGFLGMTYAPFTVQNPGTLPENIAPPGGVDTARMTRRASLFEGLEKGFSEATVTGKGTGVLPAAQAHSDIYGKAMSLVVSKRKEVFQIDPTKDKALIEEYGNNGFGKGCLMARKLVEAGAVAVEVELGGWDMHANIFNTLANQRLPVLDKAMGALVADLKRTGLLQDTVIVWMGEFGRTPRINQNAGRDHYPAAWSVVVGGGKIKGGQAYGSTDKDGVSAADKPVSINDLFATIYAAMDIDPTPEKDASIRDNLGRPYLIAGEADKFKVIKELVG